ncbi:MAG: aminotransferase class I/II-fold pyridoxal phosphate-dependent enzyme [Thermincola sp.]|nr:aminotransferase class I/II-fold pyridoxal phosphate-dependent enzyme [Thermincola sp.]
MNETGKTPLIKALDKNQKLRSIPFHMPGHKRGTGAGKGFARLMKTDPFSLDLTEVPGLDDLHNPCGPIKEAQAAAAGLFGAEQTFFLVNGTSVGIHAAIMSICKPNDVILLPRDVHRSVIGACILSGARPEYLPARVSSEFFIPLPPTAQDVKEALGKYEKVKAILQVYPSYYGIAGNLKEIADLAHSHKVPLIVDEAHGAHFAFSSRLPAPALKQGADISVQSTHKTLGALTQASMLHINSRLVSGAEVFRHLKILQSTSPSYLLMASLDAVVGQMERAGKTLMEKTVDHAIRVRREIMRIPGLQCLDEKVGANEGGFVYDPTKLYISFKGIGLTGYQAARILRKKYKIQVELSDLYNVLCMLSYGNTADDTGSLVRALVEMAAVKRPPLKLNHNFNFSFNPLVIMTPREAWFAPRKRIPMREAVGQVAAEIFAPYPPGIPLLCPGEAITRELVEIIISMKAQSCSFHGPGDPSLETVEVIAN